MKIMNFNEEEIKNWFRNNWRWATPSGCLGCGCLTFFLIFIGTVSGMVSCAKDLYRSSGTYQTRKLALEKIKSNSEIVTELGKPLRDGWPAGKISEKYKNNKGKVCQSFFLYGSQKSAEVHLEASKNTPAPWKFRQLVLNIEGKEEPVYIVSPTPNSSKKEFCLSSN